MTLGKHDVEIPLHAHLFAKPHDRHDMVMLVYKHYHVMSLDKKDVVTSLDKHEVAIYNIIVMLQNKHDDVMS